MLCNANYREEKAILKDGKMERWKASSGTLPYNE